MAQYFNGKRAFVTGAASGIGAALARALDAAGAHVVVADRDAAGVTAMVGGLSERAEGVVLDVTDADAFAAAAEATRLRLGAIDLLFNNAGVGLAGAVRDHTLADWKRVVDVNIWGVINGIQAVYKPMVERGAGHIINIASGAALAPRPGMTPYAMTKSAVVGLSVSLRAEAALHGVRISAVCPGYIDTNIQKSTQFVNVDGKKLMEKVPIRPLSAERCVQIALKGVRRNKAIIPISALVWIDWLLFRLSPALSIRVARWRAAQFDAHRIQTR